MDGVMKFAVIRTGGKQYKVSEGEFVQIEKLSGEYKEGDKIVFDDVLLVDDGASTVIGTPKLSNKVEATLEKIDREDKETVIKNYEEMLEEASVKFPCNCGNNMFDGIFKPMEETVVECDYCKSKYAITLKLDTVLITEPLEDLNIDNLIRKNTEQ